MTNWASTLLALLLSAGAVWLGVRSFRRGRQGKGSACANCPFAGQCGCREGERKNE